MARAEVRTTLNLLSTNTFDGTNYESMYAVDILLQRKYEKRFRVGGGGQEYLVVEEQPAAPSSFCSIQIPMEWIALPIPCADYLVPKIRRGLNLNLDLEGEACLCYSVAQQIASYAYRVFMMRGPSGFYVRVDVEVVREIVEEVEPWEIMPLLDHSVDDVPAVSRVRRRGASKKALNKLKRKRFYLKEGQGQGESASDTDADTDTCAVCLEDFSTDVALIPLPCTHVFHEKCIFRWLDASASCPLCRSEVKCQLNC